MRVEQSIKNIKTAIIYQITILLFNFIDRKIFLQVLGIDYLGLNGLFNNIIVMLSLAELGIGTAIIYNLYSPLQRGDKEEVAALMQFYKKAYQVIGVGIACIGMVVALALPVFIKEPTYSMSYIRGIYFIFLAGTVLTYFTGYKRSLLYADQKNYILLIGDMSANTIGVITKIGMLLITPSYIPYVVAHVIFKLIPNIWASYKVDQLYPYLKKIKSKLEPQKLTQIKNNVKDLFVHKIAQFLVLSTDNLIISSFIGLQAVGLVANYNMIIVALMGFIGQVTDGIQASLGNLVASESKEKTNDIYDKLTFASFWIGSFCAVCLVCLVQPFIILWLGGDYLLNSKIALIMIINFFLWTLTRPTWQMMTVAGLFKEDKINALVEIVVNLVVSLLLVQRLGIMGVFIGTMISYIVAWIMKSRLLYRKFFKKPYASYYVKIVIYSLVTAFEVFLTYNIVQEINISNDYLRFGIQMVICAILPNIINYILFAKTQSFKYFAKLIKGVMMEVLESLKTDKMVGIIQKTLFAIVAVLMFVMPIELTKFEGGAAIGKLAVYTVCLVTTLYIGYLLITDHIWTQKIKKIIGIYILFMAGLTVVSFLTGGMEAVKVTIWMALTLNVGIAFGFMDYKKIGKLIYIIDVGALVYIGTVIKDYMKPEEKSILYSFIFTNANYLGMTCVLIVFLCLLAYSLTNGKRYVIYSIGLLWITYLSRSRAATLALVATAIVYAVWNLIIKYKKVYYIFFALTILTITVIVLLYPMANNLTMFEELNEKVAQVTPKSIFSGREELWGESIELITKKLLLGYGMAATLQELTEGINSTHNVYLQLLLQGGILLFTPFILLITWIWKRLYKAANNELIRAGASCLVGILVIGTFELTLLGQIIPLSIIQWFIIGVGLSPALYKKNDTKDLEELN